MKNAIISKNITLILCVMCCQGNAFSAVKVDGSTINPSIHENVRQYLQVIRYATIDEKYWTDPTFSSVDENDPFNYDPPGSIAVIDEMQKLEDHTPFRSVIVQRYLASSKEVYQFVDRRHWARSVSMRMQVIAQLKLMNAEQHYWYAPTDKPATRELYTTTSVTFWKNATTHVNLYDQFQGSSYDAILSLCDIRSKTFGECRGAIHACIWNGAAVANGKAKFDAVHKDLLKMSSPDTRPSPSLKIHVIPAVDKDVKTLIPGDWVFMKNHNYQDVIKVENGFQGRSWLKHSSQYHWSGENYLMVGESPTGESLYEGLGSGPLTEADARKFMTNAYNEAFVNLWMNGATLKNGTLVTRLTEEEAERKIIFLPSSIFRITP